MIVLAALFMFVEEWIWDHLAALMAWIARAPVFRWLELRLAALPPYPALALFLLPGLLLLPVKIIALWLIAHGQALAGGGVFIAAKIVGTAIVARLFTICRPSLLTVRWFQRLYDWLVRLKTRLYHSAPWQRVVATKNRLRAWWKRITTPLRGGRLKRRWKAIVHLIRRKFTRPQVVRTVPCAASPVPPNSTVPPNNTDPDQPQHRTPERFVRTGRQIGHFRKKPRP